MRAASTSTRYNTTTCSFLPMKPENGSSLPTLDNSPPARAPPLVLGIGRYPDGGIYKRLIIGLLSDHSNCDVRIFICFVYLVFDLHQWQGLFTEAIHSWLIL
jgi:hypothetical protein